MICKYCSQNRAASGRQGLKRRPFLPVERWQKRLDEKPSSPARADTNTPVVPTKTETQGYFLSFGGTRSPFVTVIYLFWSARVAARYPRSICYIVKRMVPNLRYRWMRPELSPLANFSTSATVTILKSPSMECFSAEAATANSTACWAFLPTRRL